MTSRTSSDPAAAAEPWSRSTPLLTVIFTTSIHAGCGAPGAMPSTLTSAGGPPSTLAASTMPFDSIPINFAGFRLATTTTVFPTSASGS